jgi:predicted amidohydrolase YtcJ
VTSGRVTEIGELIEVRPGEEVIDAAGGALIPGLHDHHVHVRAGVAAMNSELLGPPEVVDASAFRRRLVSGAARARPGDWVRGIGYHESVAGLLDRCALDEVVRDVPVRIQHRSGSLWLLNSLGVTLLGLSTRSDEGIERDGNGTPTGRLWRCDHLLHQLTPSAEPSPERFGARAASYGITGLTDASPHLSDIDLQWLTAASESRCLRQRLHVMCPLNSGVSGLRMSTGPVKVLLDDTTLPSLDELAEVATRAYAEGRRVAIHCVTRAQIALTVAALKAVGTPGGDRIEHAAIVPPDLDSTLASLGVVLVTQPNFVTERGDSYADVVDPRDLAALYRCQTLVDHGVAIAAGTDTPFGDANPWAAMRAAVDRKTLSGRVLSAKERIDAYGALRLFMGRADRPSCSRSVAPGEPADFCLLWAPLKVALRELSPELVRLTIVDGECIFGE